jgi:CRISPR-associated protein Cas5d
MFERRARKGQCFHTPYLGTREFACTFQLADTTPHDAPIDCSDHLGWMLYDMDFSDPESPKPLFYRPVIQKGVINVPHPDSTEVVR